jgi:hypothetical protein
MENKNIVVMSVLIALVALVILILSLLFVMSSQPATKAKIENILLPSGTSGDKYDAKNIIKVNDGEGGKEEDEDNDPVISGLPDITLAFGETKTLDLDSYASDDEDSHSDLEFIIIYTPTVSPDPITLNINTLTHVLTITESNGAWEGTPAVTIRVEDTDGNTDEDSFIVTISNGSSASPVVSGLPDITFVQGGSDSSIDLNNYVTDADNTDDEMTWTYSGNTNVIVNIGINKVVTFTSAIGWTGSETIIFRATDPDSNYDEGTMVVTVTSIGTSSPVVSGLPDIEFDEDETYNLDLNDYVTDADNLDSELTWTYSGNTDIIVSIDSNNEVTFSAPVNWNGDEDITFRVTDPDGNWDEETINVEVNPVSDSTIWQSLSDQTINEDSAAGTIIYVNIASRVSDSDGPVTINVASSNTHFTLNIVGNNLVLTQLNKNWYGFETVTLEANGQTASFRLNVNQLIDDCITICSYSTCYTYCD